MLPVIDASKRTNSLVGGASLWVMEGKSKEEYKAAAAFLKYVTAADTGEKYIAENTGYIPVTNKGFELLKAEGFYDGPDARDRDIAIASLTASEVDAAVARHPARQLHLDPHGNPRRARGGLHRPEGHADAHSTRRSTAATRSCAATSRPTRAPPCRDRALTSHQRWGAAGLAAPLPSFDCEACLGKARDLLQPLARGGVHRSADAAGLRLLLLAVRRGALLGVDAGAALRRRPTWVGWLNFDTVFSDPKYWGSVRVSLIFAAAATAISLVIAAGAGAVRRSPADRPPGLPIHVLPALRAGGARGRRSPSASSSRPTPASSRRSTASFPASGTRRSTATTRWR